MKHGNLAKKTLFYDKVHLSKFKGVTIMKNNIINSFKNIFPNLEVSYTIQPAFGKPFRPREPLPAAAPLGHYSKEAIILIVLLLMVDNSEILINLQVWLQTSNTILMLEQSQIEVEEL